MILLVPPYGIAGIDPKNEFPTAPEKTAWIAIRSSAVPVQSVSRR